MFPAREVDGDSSFLKAIPKDDPFRLAWEFLLSHDLTAAEGAAFWNGASLVYRAMNGRSR